jgi:hypothetical protein
MKINQIEFYEIEKFSILDDTPDNSMRTFRDEKEKSEQEKNTAVVSEKIRKNLQENENFILLTWAWSSIASDWPPMSKLWTHMTTVWGQKSDFNDRCIVLKYTNPKTDNNIEKFLSLYEVYIENLRIQWDSKLASEEAFKKEIVQEIKEQCNKAQFQEGKSEHFALLDALTYIRKKEQSRVKIFTLNYDTVFEQAANIWGYTVIDGFSFTIPRVFNGNNFDLDIVERKSNRMEERTFYKKVFHLYKMHGSLDWTSKMDNFQKNQFIPGDPDSGTIIYPWSSKYEQSYKMPYFEMLTRFQSELRKDGVALNIVWYGFSDDHVNRMIKEAIVNNTSITVNIFWWTNLVDTSVADEVTFRNNFLKELEPFMRKEVGKVSFFKMKFWGFVKLLQTKDRILTKEEIIADLINKTVLSK